MKVAPRPAAEEDLQEIYQHLGDASPQVAERFFDAVARTFNRIATYPGLSLRLDLRDPHMADLRVCTVERFKSYLVFYRVVAEQVDVIRILHDARGDIEKILSDSIDPG